MKRTGSGRPDGSFVFMMGIFILFLLGALALVLQGAGVYPKAVQGQKLNNEKRAVLSYLTGQIANCDSAECVQIGKGPQGDMLILKDRETDGAYETRIYVWEEKLVEAFVQSDASEPLDGTGAEPVADCTVLEIRELEGGLLLHTDQGEAVVKLRSRTTGYATDIPVGQEVYHA